MSAPAFYDPASWRSTAALLAETGAALADGSSTPAEAEAELAFEEFSRRSGPRGGPPATLEQQAWRLRALGDPDWRRSLGLPALSAADAARLY